MTAPLNYLNILNLIYRITRFTEQKWCDGPCSLNRDFDALLVLKKEYRACPPAYI